MVFFSAQLTWTMYFAVNLGNHLVFSWFNPRNLHFHNHHVAAKLVFTRVCPPRSDVYWCCCIYLVNSKPLTYAIALNELGSETVHRYVGQEPSGRMFNELILDHNSKSLLFTNPAMTQTTQLTKLNRQVSYDDILMKKTIVPQTTARSWPFGTTPPIGSELKQLPFDDVTGEFRLVGHVM